MPLQHLRFGQTPKQSHRVRRRIRHDERVQVNNGIAEPGLDILNRLVKLDLGVSCSDVADTFRVHEDHMLFSVDEQPENKVGVEITRFEEADAPPFAQVAKQVKFLASKESAIVLMEGFEVFHELTFASV